MGRIVFYLIPVVCIILVFVLYNHQLGAIPLLLLAFYLFYAGWRMVSQAKKKSR